MKHARKIMIISPSSSRPDPLLNQYQNLDAQISSILNDKNLQSNDKIKLYQQTLNKYIFTDTKIINSGRRKEDIILAQPQQEVSKIFENPLKREETTTAIGTEPSKKKLRPATEDYSDYDYDYDDDVDQMVTQSRQQLRNKLEEPLIKKQAKPLTKSISAYFNTIKPSKWTSYNN